MYRVIITPNYYGSTINGKQAHYATKDDIDDDLIGTSDGYLIHEWDRREDAQKWADDKESGTYGLSHGEAGRPAYKAVDYDNQSELPRDCIKHCAEKEGWIEVNRDSIPDIADELDDGYSVEYDNYYDESHDIFSAEAKCVDGKYYRVTYCVSTLAQQDSAGDLGRICWEHPCYYTMPWED